MVPTFCADGPKPQHCGPADAALGKAKAGDGDLPLAKGEGGGEPKRESSSCGRSSLSCSMISDNIPGCKGKRGQGMKKNPMAENQTPNLR